ncbi:hypothetical protein SNE40_018300 [Patella caerulea]|uniref:Uncharacterized protein n=1 Tax=Patella caerulea TaxID=87958 RepID=A0AAN8J9C7_PATCE
MRSDAADEGGIARINEAILEIASDAHSPFHQVDAEIYFDDAQILSPFHNPSFDRYLAKLAITLPSLSLYCDARELMNQYASSISISPKGKAFW